MITAIVFILLLMIGTPIFVVLGVTGITYIFDSGSIKLISNVPQQLFSGIDQYSLLAIPLFMLAGELMNFGGITARLIRFSKTLFGHFKGGLAYVNVIANTFLASILGSSTSQTAMMCSMMVPEMEKDGYKRDFSAATTAAAAMMGPIIPPSMTFIIYSVAAGTSIGTMFMAGILPGLLLALAFICLIAFFGYKLNFPKSKRATMKEILKAFIEVIPALSIPAVIVGGILGGIFTATESAAVACLVALVSGMFIYRELKWKDIPNVLIATGMTTAVITILMVCAKLFGLVITYERIPQLLVELMVSLTDNPLVFLVMVNIFLLLVGMFLDGISVLVILVPILAPVAAALNVDLIHFGIIFCINAVIGSLTPPVGTGLFVASSVANVKFEDLVKAILPFLIAGIVVLLLITFFPILTLFIPSMIS